ncbi:MAG: ribonuclease H-like domain-containing protein [Acidobacteria bacterium]|nr:ribonuclease H-like domain-containing protein [Acidobacteriota bacterium]
METLVREWLWGWDPTPGIVSVWADGSGRAWVWRRVNGVLLNEQVRYRPWVLTDSIDHLTEANVTWHELEGPGALRFHVSAETGRTLTDALLAAASARYTREVRHLSELDKTTVLNLSPEEQYLVGSGRTYFRDLAFDDLRRLQFDIETTGLDARHSRVFLIAVRHPDGHVHMLESASDDDEGERALLRQLDATVLATDPDVIENHNLHGFDLPFLEHRARTLGVRLQLGRVPGTTLRRRAARRGFRDDDSARRVRFVAPGRELIDTLDAVRAYDFAARDLPGHGLKAVARHLGVAGPDRELIRGDQIHTVFRTDPDRVRRYAAADVEEAAAIARIMGGATFALAKMAPRRYERLADAGPATGIIDPLIVRAYIRANAALPAHQRGDGTIHTGAALHLFATGVAHRIVKADVASLYPSLMRAFRIGPDRDRLGVLLTLVDNLVEHRLAAKAAGKAAPPGSAARHTHEAMSAAIKLVVNSAYGYLAAGEGLTRFADVAAANEVTRRGRETLGLICRELASRGVQLLEADTDGVYFAVPDTWTEADERRVVSEVGALLPPLVHLEFEGRYAAMLSHEPKNYALLTYDERLQLKGVAFRSSRAEPFGDAFLRRAISCLLRGDIPGVRESYLSTVFALRRRTLPTYDVSSRVRLTKTPDEYAEVRGERRELTYEAMLACGHTTWRVGERVRVYRTAQGSGGVVPDPDDEAMTTVWVDRRDYDVDHYVRILTQNFASRLERSFSPDDHAAIFSDPEQPSLFARDVNSIRASLHVQPPAEL